jgi:predicted peptidase
MLPGVPVPMPNPPDRRDPRKDGKRPPGTPDLKKDDKKADEKPEPKKEPKKEEKKAETGHLKRTNAAGDREYWAYVPEDYDPNISYALVLWLHPAGKPTDKEIETLIDNWEDFCKDQHLILVGPRAESENGWVGSEAEPVLQIVHEMMNQYTIDHGRVVAHGMGIGGQFAIYLGLNFRETIHGVAATGAVFTGKPKDNVGDQRLAFFLVAGGKDPLRPAIAESKIKLSEFKYPVWYREIADMGHQYLDTDTLEELVRWIDSLDRQ